MNVIRTLAVGFAVVSLGAAAQDTNRYDGEWRAFGIGFSAAQFSLHGAEGKWKLFNSGAGDGSVCTKLERPVVVQRATDEELVFVINGSKVLAECPDFVVTLKPIDASTLEGTFNGRAGFKAVRAGAQVSTRYDGDWRVSAPGIADGNLSLHGTEGTWKVFIHGSGDSAPVCLRFVRTVTVQHATAEELVFVINGSKGVGCPDIVLTFKPIDASTLEEVTTTGRSPRKAVRR